MSVYGCWIMDVFEFPTLQLAKFMKAEFCAEKRLINKMKWNKINKVISKYEAHSSS